jgi:hypothetical protein
MSYRLLKKIINENFEFDTSMVPDTPSEANPAAGIFSQATQDHPDVVTMDVPTLIRVMEWAHEDCSDDVMLHRFAQALIITGFDHSPLTMDDYQQIVSEVEGEGKEQSSPPPGMIPGNSVEMQNN